MILSTFKTLITQYKPYAPNLMADELLWIDSSLLESVALVCLKTGVNGHVCCRPYLVCILTYSLDDASGAFILIDASLASILGKPKVFTQDLHHH